MDAKFTNICYTQTTQILKKILMNFVKPIKRSLREKSHKDHLWDSIYKLRNSIIDDVLIGSKNGRIPVKKLKHKAELIRKYSRRLKLINT